MKAKEQDEIKRWGKKQQRGHKLTVGGRAYSNIFYPT